MKQYVIILFFTLFLFPIQSTLLNCLITHKLSPLICNKCQIGYLLNQSSTQCFNAQPNQNNCIQISKFGDCIRCDCGFSLTTGEICEVTPSDLIGCEVFNVNHICIRPKENYSLHFNNQQFEGIYFGRGSNCEIRNILDGECQQCHSGYLLNEQMLCVKSSLLANQFFSYYTKEGKLKSKSFQFVVGDDGVYEEIKFCIEQKGTGDLKTSFCSKCQLGKLFNQSKSACFKAPFKECLIVSNEDPTQCVECIDNHIFYLVTNKKLNKQQCVHRSQQQTELCLNQDESSSLCSICSNGLTLTEKGCSLHENKERSDSQVMKEYFIRLIETGCEYFEDNYKCSSCKPGNVIDTVGNCRKSIDSSCLIEFKKGRKCKRCQFLMYYNEELKKCTQIDSHSYCLLSSGENNSCTSCFSGYFLNPDNTCELIEIRNCAIISNKKSCLRCQNLYFLNQFCERIKEQNCLMSDGIHEQCLKCKKHYSFNDDLVCIPQQIKNGEICPEFMFYTTIEETPRCMEYSIKESCFRYHQHKNECIECYSSYYLENGKCLKIKDCSDSEGFTNKCLRSTLYGFYLDEQGNSQRMEKQCPSNGIDNKCTYCIMQENKFGIYCNEICIPFNQLSESMESCSHLQKYGDTYSCEFCQSRMYLNQQGTCAPLDDLACLFSSGRTNECILCQKTYQFNEITKLCEKSQIIPNCEIEDSYKCIKCLNLFQLYTNQICIPISDPDCLLSDGLQDICMKCKNGQDSFLTEQFNFCGLTLCEEIDLSTNNCSKCPEGLILTKSFYQSPFDNSKKEVFQCIMKKTNDCAQKNSLTFQCEKCDEGYVFIQFPYHTKECKQINSSTCISMDFNQKCFSCEQGYDLTTNGICRKMKGCIQFNGECLRCKINFFLLMGQCFKIFHCIDQQNYKCLKCEEGFSLNKEIDYLKIIDNMLYSGIIIFDQCLQILNCKKSDGENELCYQCNPGFSLKNGICFKSKQNPCVIYDHNDICLKCKNLFSINDGECKSIKIKYCNESDGISEQCTQCQTSGFYLFEEHCLLFDHCIISNGVDACVICEKGYISTEKGECIEFSLKIENCKYYSYKNDLSILQQTILYMDKNVYSREQIQENLNVLTGKDEQELNSILDIRPIPFGGCLQCENFSFLDGLDFQKCTKIEDLSKINCFQVNYHLPTCSICLPGFIYKIILPFSNGFKCQPTKIFIKTKNLGCSHYSSEEICVQCSPPYYLDDNKQCQERQQDQKCSSFNPVKDECLICQSRYILMIIAENQTICIQLSSEQQVENCLQYLPNSSKCIQCTKYLKQDVVEFILNEEENKCESVLDLMCHKINLSTKTCLVDYIPNCEEYENLEMNSQKCAKCKNSFYYDEKNSLCLRHKQIKNCLFYHQTEQNNCLRCIPFFFLSQDHMCIQSLDSHCKIYDSRNGGCSLCEKNYAVDQENRNCVENNILNCLRLKISLLKEQICLQCRINFVMKDNGRICIFSLIDINCEILDENQECLQCREGYFLTSKGDCIDKYSICEIQNCQFYDENSSQENILCKECYPNYSLDTQLKCSFIDPDSDIISQKEIDVSVNIDKVSLSQQMIISLLVLGVVICLIIITIKVIQYQKSIRNRNNNSNVQEQDEENEDSNNNISKSIEMISEIKVLDAHQSEEESESIFQNLEFEDDSI